VRRFTLPLDIPLKEARKKLITACSEHLGLKGKLNSWLVCDSKGGKEKRWKRKGGRRSCLETMSRMRKASTALSSGGGAVKSVRIGERRIRELAVEESIGTRLLWVSKRGRHGSLTTRGKKKKTPAHNLLSKKGER